MASRYLITGGASVVWDASNTGIWSSTSGGSVGASVPVDGDAVIFDAASGGGTVTLGYSPTVTSITMGAFTGTFDASTFSPTMDSFDCSGTGTRTLTMGSGQWTIRGNAAQVWNIGTFTNLTFNKGTNPVVFNYAGSTGTRTIVNGAIAPLQLSSAIDVSITAGTDLLSMNGSRYGHLSFAGFSGTLNSGTRVVYGDLTTSATMTWATGTAVTTFAGTSDTQTITTNGLALNSPFTIDGVGGTVTLAGNFSMDGASVRGLTITNGTFNANGYNVTCGNVQCTNANVRTLTMGTGTWTLTGTGNVWNLATTTNLTFSGASSTIVFTDTSASAKNFNSGTGAATYGTFSATGGGSGVIAFNSNNKSFTTFTIPGPKSVTFTASTTYTITNLNLTGSAGNLVTLASSTPGTQYTLSVASGDVYARYVSLQDSRATGGARFFALNSTNVSNNTGWNFVASRTAATGRFTLRDDSYAISLDGSTSYLVKASPTGINNGTNGSVTVSVWVNLRTNDIGTVAELHVNGNTSPSFGIGQTGGQYVLFSDRVNVLNNKNISKATFDTYIGTNRWVMLTYVLTSAAVTVYAGTTAILPSSAIVTPINAGTISSLFFGKGQTTAQADIQFLPGIIKKPRIFNGALTAQQVSDLYYSELNASTVSGAWNMDAGSGTSVVDSVGTNNLTGTNIAWTTDRPFGPRQALSGRTAVSNRYRLE